MRTYTDEECRDWLSARKRTLPGGSKYRIAYGAQDRRLAFKSLWLSENLAYRQPVLLWITEWGIWPSSENWHLYYCLRKSQGDHLLLEEAPGHLFLDYETAELRSCLQVALMNGWGGYLLTAANYINAFFSHDSYMDFFADDAGLDEVRQALEPN